MSVLYKLEHNFEQDIKTSLRDSCKDTKIPNCVNFICKDGVVSCDNTLLASVSNRWKTILMTTNADTNYIIAPDYSQTFIKNYLLSSIHTCNANTAKEDIVGYHCDAGRKDLENYDAPKCARENDLEKYDDPEVRGDDLENYDEQNSDERIDDLKTLKDPGGESELENCKGKLVVNIILNELIETLLEVCVQDDEKQDYAVRSKAIHQKVKKIREVFKSPLIDTFKVKEKTTCNICLKQFSRPANCREHMKNCSSEEKYKCDKCDAKFRTKKGLKTHSEYSHENESKDPFICNICGRVFLHKRSLIRHCKETQHSSYPKNDKRKVFKWGNKTGVKCNICHKMIVSYALDIHMKSDHSEEAREFKCTRCDFKTNRRYSLKRHDRDVHQRYESDFCAIKESFEEGVSKYQCPDCKKILSSINEIEDHLIGKICSMTCNICDKTFSRKDNLKKHKKRFH